MCRESRDRKSDTLSQLPIAIYKANVVPTTILHLLQLKRIPHKLQVSLGARVVAFGEGKYQRSRLQARFSQRSAVR
jgi:hypothetical protein